MSEKYGWALDAEDGAHGPFDSEAEALADAKEVLCGDEPLTGKFYEVEIGQCEFIDPGQFISLDVDETLERMEERAYDDGYAMDGDTNVFEIPDERLKEAEEALTKVLEEWARKYVDHENVWLLAKSRKVKIGDDQA